MTIDEAIAAADAILPGRAASDGEVDPRWQAIINVGDFVETDPEAVWPFVERWGASADQDLRMAIATCVLEHLLEYHFDRIISRVEQAALRDARFADTLSYCAKFGQSEERTRAARLDALVRKTRPRIE